MAWHNGVFQATDQASLSFLKSEADRIEAMVRMEELGVMHYPDLLFVDTTAMDVADDMLVSYVGRPGTGQMTPLANGGRDLSRIEVEYDVMRREAKADGIAYGWDDMEVERGMKTGRMPSDKVTIAFEIAERHKESIVLHGNMNYGWPGLVTNQPTGASAFLEETLVSGEEWSIGNTVNAFNTIRKAFTKIFVETNQVFQPDTLLLSPDAMAFLTTPLSGGSGNATNTVSVWEYLRINNPYSYMNNGAPMRIFAINGMTPGTGLLYSSMSKALRFIVAQDLNFIGPQREAFSQTWYGRMKLGGVQIFHPKAFCKILNIGTFT